jgi:hypothetical protein
MRIGSSRCVRTHRSNAAMSGLCRAMTVGTAKLAWDAWSPMSR